MKRAELIKALGRLKIETGSIACLGCGHEHNCATQGCAIIRAAVEELKKMRWIPVEERVPKGNRMTLVLTANGAVVAARFISRLQSWTGPGRYATHWMLLPEPPEMEAEG